MSGKGHTKTSLRLDSQIKVLYQVREIISKHGQRQRKIAMASILIVMASTLIAMASNLRIAMASSLIAMASDLIAKVEVRYLQLL